MPENSDSYQSWADDYDDKSREMKWYGPEVLFGLMCGHIKSGETLLDLGIGTGLASAHFIKAGLNITGIDSSPVMLEKCREKGRAAELVKHDLERFPWPLGDRKFNHIISTGVMHFFGELDGLFKEAARIIKPGGMFGFDFYEFDSRGSEGYSPVKAGIYSKSDVEYNMPVFRHSEEYIFSKLRDAGFEIVDDVEFLVSKNNNMYFRTIVAKRI